MVEFDHFLQMNELLVDFSEFVDFLRNVNKTDRLIASDLICAGREKQRIAFCA